MEKKKFAACRAVGSRCPTPVLTTCDSGLVVGAGWARRTLDVMCRSIKPLNNLDPPVTHDEVHAAALQYVRKVAGTRAPSRANAEAFDRAVHEIAHATEHLLASLSTTAEPRTREELAAVARARFEARGRR